MDEDAQSDYTGDEQDQEAAVRRRINKDTRRRQKPGTKCRTRIDVLATPNRRLILALYQNHAHHFPKERVEKLKEMLQQLYAMTPEETERYFAEMEAVTARIMLRKRIKDMMRKRLRNLKKREQQAKAMMFIQKLIKKGMLFAFNHPVPPLVSIRLRNLSDIVLEQICDLRNTDIPDREDPDQIGLFLIAVSDWIAIFIEHVYYIVQLKKNRELEEIEKNRADSVKESTPGSPMNTEAVIVNELGDEEEEGQEVPVGIADLDQDVE
ncbi:unnamed protein product [Acanthoscelides obtectus]|uniref:Uncharacterized protein n=1 Tax=Acanthoscelides obtectus TaxID=200917 RepID=A0A9P0KP06_ACAOB|nr:unnamed protein product [Acanthoscelides obtectus]CAK1675540.1 hypothetical protein AOBTE_LOCUS30285 [Acanthoscelides obtectus]